MLGGQTRNIAEIIWRILITLHISCILSLTNWGPWKAACFHDTSVSWESVYIFQFRLSDKTYDLADVDDINCCHRMHVSIFFRCARWSFATFQHHIIHIIYNVYIYNIHISNHINNIHSGAQTELVQLREESWSSIDMRTICACCHFLMQIPRSHCNCSYFSCHDFQYLSIVSGEALAPKWTCFQAARGKHPASSSIGISLDDHSIGKSNWLDQLDQLVISEAHSTAKHGMHLLLQYGL